MSRHIPLSTLLFSILLISCTEKGGTPGTTPAPAGNKPGGAAVTGGDNSQAVSMAERFLRTHERVQGEISVEGQTRSDSPWTVVTLASEGRKWEVRVNPATGESRDAIEMSDRP